MTHQAPRFPVADPSPAGSADKLPGGGVPPNAVGSFLSPATHAEPEAMSLSEARAVVALVADHDDQTIARACSIIFYSSQAEAQERQDAQGIALLLNTLLLEYVTCHSIGIADAIVGECQGVEEQIRRAFHVQI